MDGERRAEPEQTLWGIPIVESDAMPDDEIRIIVIHADGDIETLGAIVNIGADPVKDGE